MEIDSLSDRTYKISANFNSGQDRLIPFQKEFENIFAKEPTQYDLKRIEEETNKLIEKLTFYDKKIKLTYNEEINRVIITVVKKDTNEIIKQYPSVEIQNLALHLKKALNTLLEKSI